jgi:hypothetical protein
MSRNVQRTKGSPILWDFIEERNLPAHLQNYYFQMNYSLGLAVCYSSLLFHYVLYVILFIIISISI